MKNTLWLIIDFIITRPAWMCGYCYEAYRIEFANGIKSYQTNLQNAIKRPKFPSDEEREMADNFDVSKAFETRKKLNE